MTGTSAILLTSLACALAFPKRPSISAEQNDPLAGNGSPAQSLGASLCLGAAGSHPANRCAKMVRLMDIKNAPCVKASETAKHL